MRIHALCLVMFVVVRAPLGLEVEDIEVEVLVRREQVMDQTHLDVVDGVCEGTVFPVLALLYLRGEAVTEFRLVFIFMVESLHSVMRPPAFVFFGTFFSICEFTELRGIEVVVSALVLDRVIIIAALMVVRGIFAGTFDSLEIYEVQMLYRQIFTMSTVRLV